MNYMFAKVNPGSNACYLKTLQEVEADYELLKGISRASNWPPEAYFKMDESFPDNLQLEDFIFNTNKVLVVSEEVKNFFALENLKNNEFLPVRIVDHKGRKVKQNNFILNQTVLQDCIDIEKSTLTINPINPDKIMNISKLDIDESKIDQEVTLFRMAKYTSLPIFRRDLAEKVLQNGFKGIKFGEISDWKGI